MEESYLFNSSLTLLALGCLAFALSIFFRLKYNEIENLPKNLSPNIFDKTFAVFNIYPARRKTIHGLLSALPAVIFLAGMGFAILVWKMLESGLALSLLLVIVGLNLIVVEDASEIYANSRAFVDAVQHQRSLGVGDIRGLRDLKNVLSRLIYYYFGLSIVFLVLSVTLRFIWPSALWFFSYLIALTLQVSASAGLVGYQVAILLFIMVVIAIQIFASKAKEKLTEWERESKLQEEH